MNSSRSTRLKDEDAAYRRRTKPSRRSPEEFLDGGVAGVTAAGVEGVGHLAAGRFPLVPEDLEHGELGFGDIGPGRVGHAMGLRGEWQGKLPRGSLGNLRLNLRQGLIPLSPGPGAPPGQGCRGQNAPARRRPGRREALQKAVGVQPRDRVPHALT